MPYRDLTIRALKTFVQTFCALVAPALTVDVAGNPDALKRLAFTAAVGALAAALSFVGNALAAKVKK